MHQEERSTTYPDSERALDEALTSIRAIRAKNRAEVATAAVRYPALVCDLSKAQRASLVSNVRERLDVAAAVWTRLDEAGRQDFAERTATAIIALSRGAR